MTCSSQWSGLGVAGPWVHREVPGPQIRLWLHQGVPGEGAGRISRYQVPVVVHGQAEGVMSPRFFLVVLLDALQVLLPDLPADGLGLLPWQRDQKRPQEHRDMG